MRDLKKFISWISVLQYRSGGDFLSSHRDAYKFQAILIMSEIGRDFSSGGQYILNEKSGSTFTEKQFKVGDLVMLRSDIYHGVYPIDQDSVLADNSINGRCDGNGGGLKNKKKYSLNSSAELPL